MVLRVAAEVEAELDEIWSYVATESGDADVAERLINSITDHFFMLSKHPQLGRPRDHDLRSRSKEPVSRSVCHSSPNRGA